MKLERKVVTEEILEATDILPTFNISETNKTIETRTSPSKLFSERRQSDSAIMRPSVL